MCVLACGYVCGMCGSAPRAAVCCISALRPQRRRYAIPATLLYAVVLPKHYRSLLTRSRGGPLVHLPAISLTRVRATSPAPPASRCTSTIPAIRRALSAVCFGPAVALAQRLLHGLWRWRSLATVLGLASPRRPPSAPALSSPSSSLTCIHVPHARGIRCRALWPVDTYHSRACCGICSRG